MLCHYLFITVCSDPHEKDFSVEKKKKEARLSGNRCDSHIF